MGFGGRDYAYASPAGAVAGMIARLGIPGTVDTEAVELGRAMGRVLGEAVACDRDSPAFDHASMDGYAVRSDDVLGRVRGEGVTLDVAGESRIGRPPGSLPGAAMAVRIATGAAMPSGADAVVRREDVREHAPGAAGGCVARISIGSDVAARVRAGDFVRRRGENARAGDVVLEPGELITAGTLGTLAAVGVARVKVARAVRVVVVSTGDELVAPGSVPGPYQIRDSNGATIGGVLASHAWIDVRRVERVDDSADLADVLRRAMDPREGGTDAVVLSGGVSVGHRDSARAAVEQIGAEVVFHGLPQRPGKPMLGAVAGRGSERIGVALFALPGNPVSSLVTCTRIVLPVMGALAGAGRLPGLVPRLVELVDHDGKGIDLWWHRPARLVGPARAELVEVRGSGDVISTARSDGFVEIPAGADGRGAVAFYPWAGCGPGRAACEQ